MDRRAPTCSASTVQTIWPYGRGRKALGLDSSNAVVTGLLILWRTNSAGSPGEPRPCSRATPDSGASPASRFLCDQIREWPPPGQSPRDLQTTHIEHESTCTGAMEMASDRQDDA